MKILHVCYSDLEGGAARAAYRLHQAQRKLGLDSSMLVVDKRSDDPQVQEVSRSTKRRVKLAKRVARNILKLQITTNRVFHSINFLSTGILNDINKIKPDIINLHWIGNEMLSMVEVTQLPAPIVWTMHDMWAFCGAEHYEDPLNVGRYLDTYNANNRNSDHKGYDIDQWCFNRKAKHWAKSPFHIVTPSAWLAKCAKSSLLLANHSIHTISNCINHSFYKPVEKNTARELFGLPLNKRLVLFGAMASTSDMRKGYSYLKDALANLKKSNNAEDIEIVIFGASSGDGEADNGIKTHYVGHLFDQVSLVALYNAADIFVAPSLQDNLPNTLVESIACGTFCVAFDIGGMSDLIPNQRFGKLVQEIESKSLASAIRALLDTPPDRHTIATQSALIRSEKLVAEQYSSLYKSLL
jgi:glycosyltransferase involved in cell wall biosynthesis